MKRFTALALVAILSLIAFTAPADAQPIFSAGGTATSTNTVVTYTTANPKFVQIANYGSSRLYAALNAVATAAFGTTISLEPCEVVNVYTGGYVNTTLGLITAASTTTTYLVTAEYQDFTSSNPRMTGFPFNHAFQKDVLPGCNSLTLLTENGAALTPFSLSELINVNTGAAATTSATNLLPANSIILGVACRVTVTVTTAATYSVGDGTTAARFMVSNANITAGQTITGLSAMFGVVSTTATGPTQASAAPLVITFNTTPGAGQLRCSSFGYTLVAPTS